MHSVMSDSSLVNWAVAGADSSILRGNTGDVSDQLFELIARYEIYWETSANWYRLESEDVWHGHTIYLCGTHSIEWPDFGRGADCGNLTHLLHTIAGSMMPLERTACRHEIGDCGTRLIEASTGNACHHSLALEISHPFSAIGRHRHIKHECLEQLENRLLRLGISRVGADEGTPL